jgi:hypothetical protein
MLAYNDGELNTSQTRSHPPPHAGCPRGDPGLLPVPYSSTLNANRLRRRIHTLIDGSDFARLRLFVQSQSDAKMMIRYGNPLRESPQSQRRISQGPLEHR